MRVCIPTTSEAGLRARLSSHFGKAPFYTVVDTDSWEIEVIPNGNTHHAHGHCNPVGSLRDARVEAVLCAGLGRNALARWLEAGVPVYLSGHVEVDGTLRSFLAGDLQAMTSLEACHGSGH